MGVFEALAAERVRVGPICESSNDSPPTCRLLDGDIHPPNKIDGGHRLAHWALAKEYCESVPFSGPAYKSVKWEEGKAVLSFDHAEDGVMIAVKTGLADP